MATLGLNHYNLRADHALMEKLRDFYCDIVGLVVGFRPPFGSRGYWLYAGEQAVLHLSEAAASAATSQRRTQNHHQTRATPRLPPQQSHHHTRATPPSRRSITPRSAARVWQSSSPGSLNGPLSIEWRASRRPARCRFSCAIRPAMASNSTSPMNKAADRWWQSSIDRRRARSSLSKTSTPGPAGELINPEEFLRSLHRHGR